MYPQRMSSSELAEVWKLTVQRVNQFVREGKIKKGSDGKIDRDEAFAFRASQLDANQARVLFQVYGNGSGPIPRKVGEHLTASPYVDADDFLSDDPPVQVSDPQQAIIQATNKHSRLTELRAQEMEFKLQRQMRQEDLAAGKLIERKEVFRAGQHAAAEITNMLNGLEHEIAALFGDHDTRSEVRTKVGAVVDRCLFALGKKFDALAKGEADEDDV